jgi:hypothetical protein
VIDQPARTKVLLVGLSTGEYWDSANPICIIKPDAAREIVRRAGFIARMTRRWNHMTKEPVDQVAFRMWFPVESEKRVRSAVLGRRYDDVPAGDIADEDLEDDGAVVDLSVWLETPEEPKVVEVALTAFEDYFRDYDPDDTDSNFTTDGMRVLVDPEPYAGVHLPGPDFRLDFEVQFKYHKGPLYTTSGVHLSLLRSLVDQT